MESKVILGMMVVLAFLTFSMPAYAEDITIAPDTDIPGCEISHICYLPSSLTVNESTVITWKNSDSAMHTVTSGNPTQGPNGQFDSELIPVGGTFQQIFSNKGDYPYYCIIHPWMQGIVTVIQNDSESSVSYSGIEKIFGTDHEVQYTITNADILSVNLDRNTNSIAVDIIPLYDGTLTITLQRTLIDASLGNGNDDDFFVLADSEDIDFKETRNTSTYRTLEIPFQVGIDVIEIIGTQIDEDNNEIWFENPNASNSPTNSYQIRQLQDTVSTLNQKLELTEKKLENTQNAYDILKNNYDDMLAEKNKEIAHLGSLLQKTEKSIEDLNLILLEQIKTIMSITRK